MSIQTNEQRLQFSPGLPAIRPLPNTRVRITINDIEKIARRRRDGIGSVRVRETGHVQWLHVIFYKRTHQYVYRWGKLSLQRKGADLLLDEMSNDIS